MDGRRTPPEMSNCYCLPGRAGGTPVVLGSVHSRPLGHGSRSVTGGTEDFDTYQEPDDAAFCFDYKRILSAQIGAASALHKSVDQSPCHLGSICLMAGTFKASMLFFAPIKFSQANWRGMTGKTSL